MPKNNQLDKELENELKKKFMCAEKFAQEIEYLVRDNKDLDYISAIVLFCEKNSIDLESVPKIISKPLKEKIKWNATKLNFLKKTTRAKLPI